MLMESNKNKATECNELMLNYILQHYWDFIQFENAHYVFTSEFTDKLKNFVWLLHSGSDAIAFRSINMLFTKAICNKEAFKQIVEMLDKLYNGRHSSMANEKRGLHVLEQASFSMLLSKEERMVYSEKISKLQLNKLGSVATNFMLPDEAQNMHEMHLIDSEYLLLYFYSFGHENCKSSSIFLQRNPVLGVMRSDERLKILAVNLNPKAEGWQSFAEGEKSWIHLCDDKSVIEKKALYEIKHLPTIYLLDSTKTVLLKDSSIEEISLFMEKHLM